MRYPRTPEFFREMPIAIRTILFQFVYAMVLAYVLQIRHGNFEFSALPHRVNKIIKVAVSDLQHISEHHGVDKLKQDCADSNWHFPKKVRRPRVAHFCGRKPFLFDRGSYSRPFTIARLEHHRRQHGELGA